MIVVTLLAVACWTILSQMRLIEERDAARRDAEYQRRLAESWQPEISDPSPPRQSLVPDARTAIRIALAVWGPIYGDDKIADEKPFVARLRNGVWTVEGSLPEGSVGGAAYIEINEADGKVLKVTHFK